VCNALSIGFIEGYTSMCETPTFKASHVNKQTCSFLCQNIPNYICSAIENANTILCAIHAEADPGFQVRWGALKIIALSGARREHFWVFRVKNHDFTQKNHIFFQF